MSLVAEPTPEPIPEQTAGLSKQKKVVGIVLDYDDGSREVIDFPPTNWAYYRVVGSMRGSRTEKRSERHEIWWKEIDE